MSVSNLPTWQGKTILSPIFMDEIERESRSNSKYLKLFLKKVKIDDLSMSTQVYNSFISLLYSIVQVKRRNGFYYSMFLIFRESRGLPCQLFPQDLELSVMDHQTEQKFSLLFSEKLLKLLYPNSEEVFSAQSSEKKLSISFLSKESLRAFYDYTYRGRFRTNSLPVLKELLELAKKLEDPEFEHLIKQQICSFFLKVDQDAFEPELLEDFEHEFTEEFLKMRNVAFGRLCNGNFHINITDFMNLFSKENAKILDFIKNLIDILNVNSDQIGTLSLIKKDYRLAIIGLRLPETFNPFSLSLRDFQNLCYCFPNAGSDLSLLEGVSLKPGDEEKYFYYILKGLIALFKNEQQEAQNFVEQAISLKPNNYLAYSLLIHRSISKEENFSYLEKALQHYNEDIKVSASIHFFRGFTFLTTDPEKAILCFKKSLEMHPKNNFGNLCLAKVLNKEGRLEEAKHYFKQALRCGCQNFVNDLPEMVDLLNIFDKQSEIEELKKILIGFLKYGEGNIVYLTLLGALYRKFDQPAALKTFKEALPFVQETQSLGCFFALLGDAQLSCGQDPEEAYQNLEKALRLDPESWICQYLLGDFFMESDLTSYDLDKAIPLLEAAYAKKPLNYEILESLSTAYGFAERVNEGISLLNKALLDSRNDPKFAAILANLLKNFGTSNELDEQLERMWEIYQPETLRLIRLPEFAKMMEDFKREREMEETEYSLNTSGKRLKGKEKIDPRKKSRTEDLSQNDGNKTPEKRDEGV